MKTKSLTPALDCTLSSTDAGSSVLDGHQAPVESDGPRYIVDEEYARGGLGRVLAARDLRLGRQVAIKELLSPTGALLDRFRREVAVTARLQHPAIVPVYDSGTWSNGGPFFVMKLVSGGRTLKTIVQEARTLNERIALLPNVIAVADAIAYAHHEQIIHRDLKPSNVLVGPFGETVVIDWGLAKDCAAVSPPEETGPYRAASTAELTSIGSIFGTPQYMPPEQARGETVDKRADVYSLGALLYFSLTGVPPFEGDGAASVVRAVVSGPPVPLAVRQPGIPEDLTTIVEKAMARDPERRYLSAQELADDLKRFQTGQLVRAHQYSTGALVKRWLTRHRATVLTATALLLALAVTSVVGVIRITRESARAERRANALILTQARSALGSDPTASLSWLKRYPADAEGWKQGRAIAVEAMSLGVARHVFPRDSATIAVGAFSADGRSYVSAGANATIRLRDVASGQTLATLAHQESVAMIALAADGHTVVFVDDDSAALHIWRSGDRDVRTLRGHSDVIADLVLSPDGRSAATASADRTVGLWNLESGAMRTFQGHQAKVHTVRFSSDGASIISASNDGSVRVWPLAGGAARVLMHAKEPIVDAAISANDVVVAATHGVVRWWDLRHGSSGTFPPIDGGVIRIAVSVGGDMAAAGCEDKSVRLMSRADNRSRPLHGHIMRVQGVAFSPRGDLLASAAQDGEIILWQPRTDEMKALRGHAPSVIGLLFSPDGGTLASVSEDRTARLWPIEPDPVKVLAGHSDQINAVAFAPDGSSLVTAARDNTVRLWSDGGSVELGAHGDLALRAIYSPDGKQIASASFDGTIKLFDLLSRSTKTLTAGKKIIWSIAFSPSGTKLVSGAAGGDVRLWDLATATSTLIARHALDVRSVAFSHDGRWIASAANDETVRLTDASTGESRMLRGHTGPVMMVAFSPDDRLLASVSSDRTLGIWNVADGRFSSMAGPGFALRRVAFSPDGARVAAIGSGLVARVWSLHDGTFRDLVGHHEQIHALAFSPDGRLLVTASYDKTAAVWSVEDGVLLSFVRHGGTVMDCAISPNGDRVATVSDDGTVSTWPLVGRSRVPQRPRDVLDWLDATTTAGISRDEVASTM